MYNVSIGKEGKTRTVKRSISYREAYYFVADKMMKEDESLSFSYSLKYLFSGFGKKKIFPYGSMGAKIDGKYFLISEAKSSS